MGSIPTTCSKRTYCKTKDEDEFYAIGGEEYFQKGICLIEWGEMIEKALPNKLLFISLPLYVQISVSPMLKMTFSLDTILQQTSSDFLSSPLSRLTSR